LAVVASQNLDGAIDWLVGSEDKADLLRRRVSSGLLRSTGVISATADRVRTISADPAQVIPSADVVIIVVPAFAHAAVLRRIRPYVGEKTAIGCLPTRGGFEFEFEELVAPRRGVGPTIFGLQTLPWSTRVVAFGEVVNIGAVKAEVVLASRPAAQAPDLSDQLSRMLGTCVIPAESFLGLTLGNQGQFIHPGLMYGHFHSWRGEAYDEGDIPLLYAQATEEMGDRVERLSTDAIKVAREVEARSRNALNLQATVLSAHEWLRRVYSHVTADTSTVASCFRTGPIQARKAPMIEVEPGKLMPDFQYRYLSEDVPFGLVVTRAIAELADVQTPAIDEVIIWAQSALEKVYLVGDKVRGPDAADLPIPQNQGVSELADLIDWYSDNSWSASSRSQTGVERS
jgi:hypothetical protein